MIDPGLQDKVVLVTGANNPFGIGAAIAAAFAAQGTSVFITYLRSRPEEFGVDTASAANATTPGVSPCTWWNSSTSAISISPRVVATSNDPIF